MSGVNNVMNMAVFNTDIPYFFDQAKRRYVKRKRKSVEQLPFSLPFTGVSGTLKVEAYLKQQLKISEQTGKERQDNPQESIQNTEEQNGEIYNRKASLSSPLQSKTREGLDFSKKSISSRREKPFPDPHVIVSRDRHEEEDDEDTQRFLFEENKFAAPNLLAQLGRLLEWLFEKQQEKMNSPRRSCNNYENWTNLTSNNLNQSIINLGASYLDVRVLDITIPFHLQEKLKWNFNQLIVNAVYTKREWQTTSYKQQEASANQRESLDDTSVAQDNTVNNNNNNNSSKQDSVPGANKNLRKSQEEHFAKIPEIQPANMSKNQGSSTALVDEANSETQRTALLGYRRESTKSTLAASLRTRLEKYKYLPDKANLGSVNVPFLRNSFLPSFLPSFNDTILFNKNFVKFLLGKGELVDRRQPS